MNVLFALLIRHEYFADVIQGNLRMFTRSNIRKLPVTTSADPHFTPGHNTNPNRHSKAKKSD